MRRVVLGGLVFASLALTPVTLATAVSQERPHSTMRFDIKREGPSEVCRDRCRLWVFASGLITHESPRDFDRFARTNDVRGATLVLDSNGGSVVGALALGRLVRSLAMTVTIGKAVPLPSDRSDPRATVSAQATCESMCAFVLLAGSRRYVQPESRVLVHQIWLGDRRDDATAAAYSAEDVALVQRDIARLVKFIQEMGGNFELLEATLRVPPWERLRVLSREELRRMGLELSEPPAGSETVNVMTTSALAGDARSLSIADRGWTFVNEDGTPRLSRRHPLTVEGDDVGSFRVTLGCGEAPESYQVTYEERRSTRSRVGSDSLKEVRVLLGGRTVRLNVVSSETAPRSFVLNSKAQGPLPASLLKEFASARARSLMVETVSSMDESTAIRLGNSGVAQNLEQLAESCMPTSARGVHAEAKPRE